MKINRFGLVIPPGVDTRTAAAMGRLLDLLTPLHSITSRQHSIATIIRRELDGEIARVISAYSGERGMDVLPGFRLSYVWLREPEDEDPTTESSSRERAPPAEGRHAVATANLRASKWRSLLKEVVRDAKEHEYTSSSAQVSRFSQTLDAVIGLIDSLSSFTPASTHESGERGRRIGLRVAGSDQQWCDLCWRPTMFSSRTDPRDADDKLLGVSRRFCAEHSPRGAARGYRRDIAHKQDFEKEVRLLAENWRTIRDAIGPVVTLEDASEPSGLQVHLCPVTPDPQDIRRAAYALVHSKLRGSGSRCWILKQQGLSTLQIVERMQLKERAVRSALATFRVKLAAADRTRLGLRTRSDRGFDGYH